MLYELRQFRAKGLFRLHEFRVEGSQFPNFPNSAGPSMLGSFGKVGSMYL